MGRTEQQLEMKMDPDVASYAQVAVVTVGLVASLCTIGVLTVRGLISSVRKQPRALPANDPRIEQLQQSVDAIALEVERIAEAQRFTTKLLAEREQTPLFPR
jgi:hypothetical protein